MARDNDNIPPTTLVIAITDPDIRCLIYLECRTSPPDISRPDKFPRLLKRKFTPDHNRPTGLVIFWKLALTRTPNLNRSTAINFVHVNGISLYIVHWRTVVVEGKNVIRRVKRERNCPEEGNVRGNISAECHDPFFDTLVRDIRRMNEHFLLA